MRHPVNFAFVKMLQSNVAVGDIYDTFLSKRHRKQIYLTSSGRTFFCKDELSDRNKQSATVSDVKKTPSPASLDRVNITIEINKIIAYIGPTRQHKKHLSIIYSPVGTTRKDYIQCQQIKVKSLV